MKSSKTVPESELRHDDILQTKQFVFEFTILKGNFVVFTKKLFTYDDNAADKAPTMKRPGKPLIFLATSMT